MKSGVKHPSQWRNNQSGNLCQKDIEQDLIIMSEQVRELKSYIKQLEELKREADYAIRLLLDGRIAAAEKQARIYIDTSKDRR